MNNPITDEDFKYLNKYVEAVKKAEDDLLAAREAYEKALSDATDSEDEEIMVSGESKESGYSSENPVETGDFTPIIPIATAFAGSAGFLFEDLRRRFRK